MDDETMAEPLRLARSLNGGTVAALAEALIERRGRPLDIDGEAVEHVGGQCLQLLIAARNTWAADGQRFGVLTPSEAMRGDLVLLGHPIELLAVGGDPE